MSNWQDAAHQLVHEAPGGCEALAVRMRVAYSTLRGMGNPNDATHEWSVRRLSEAMHLTADVRPLHALAREHGGVFVPVAGLEAVGDGDLLVLANKLAAEFGDVPRALAAALDARGEAGRAITRREFEHLQTQVYEMQAAAAELLARVEARVVRRPEAMRVVK
jgi:hypothetical protein